MERLFVSFKCHDNARCVNKTHTFGWRLSSPGFSQLAKLFKKLNEIMVVVSVDQVKYVVNELNSRLAKKLNVISYDNLRNEQRIEMLLQVFQEIDPSVSLRKLRETDDVSM